ncbi:MAG: hypothetical protein U5K30_00395 [Acidimicrobiales bacterium]|nr:hypothetical protein [Acidimicrobiales bacterium]
MAPTATSTDVWPARDVDETERDRELDRLALLGNPDAPLPDDAVPFDDVVDPGGGGADLLPDWYMPAPMAGGARLGGWRRVVAWVIVAAFLAIAAAGLCSTYGEVVIA